tara:strand:+ start:976 stop:2961 length:1986 start_codon:yes stop_codon:yes gene_type:complete
MANKKISELTPLSATPAGDDVVPLVDTSASATKSVTVSHLLASKADSSHSHAISDVTNLQTSLDAKQATVTAGDGLSFSVDTLNAEVTQAELDAKQDTVTAGDGLSFAGSTLNAEVTQAELDAKAASSHTHTLSDITDSGTAAPLNVASSGDAASSEVVKGDDSRLTDARTPSSHTHAASEISDFDTEVTNNTAVTANTAKVTNATHTGEVTGDAALTIADNVVDEANLKVSNSPTDGYSLVARSGETGGLKWESVSGAGGTPAGSAGELQFNDGSNNFDASSNLVWDNSNNRLGVGGTPDYPLTIKDGSSAIGFAEYTNGAVIWLDGDDGDFSGGGYFNILADGATALRFGYGAANKISMLANGHLGLGTDLPSAPLHVTGATTDGDSIAQVAQTSTGYALHVSRNVESATRQMVSFAQIHASGGSQPAVHIQQADSDEIALGIDTSGTVSSPTFSVKGNGAIGLDSGDYGTSGQVLTSGGSSAAATWTTLSDNDTTYTAGTGLSLSSTEFSADIGTGSTQVAAGDHNHDSDYQALDTDTAKTDVVQTFTAGQRGEVTELTDEANIAVNLNDSNNFSVTLGGNRTLDNPSNCTAGQSGVITITQPVGSTHTLLYGSYWKFSGGTAPDLTGTAEAVDVLAYYVESADRITATIITDTKQTT